MNIVFPNYSAKPDISGGPLGFPYRGAFSNSLLLQLPTLGGGMLGSRLEVGCQMLGKTHMWKARATA